MSERTGPPEAVDRVAQTAEIVAAYVRNNALNLTDLPRLITDVHASLLALTSGAQQQPVEELRPAVPIKKSVTPDYIVCLEDGKKFKSLKRHLATYHDMTPDQYRARWSLPKDYPMVASNYSATRSQLAKNAGLGRKAASAGSRRRA